MSNAEMDLLRVGSVVRGPKGFRVVRGITRRPAKQKGALSHLSVTFTIQRPSWTGRCYTVLFRTDLLSRHYQPTTAVVPLMSALDREIARNIHTKARTLSHRDVRGIP